MKQRKTSAWCSRGVVMYEFAVSPFGVSLLGVLAVLGIFAFAFLTREMRAGRKQQQLRQRQRQQFWGYE